jgi:hypothetical protein
MMNSIVKRNVIAERVIDLLRNLMFSAKIPGFEMSADLIDLFLVFCKMSTCSDSVFGRDRNS